MKLRSLDGDAREVLVEVERPPLEATLLENADAVAVPLGEVFERTLLAAEHQQHEVAVEGAVALGGLAALQ